ncbi:MAG: ferrous iron transport protein B [Nannocystaceae bacterium]|nr:ferrous iron transport protein B [Nannocystaceae bacterium]
MNIAVAGNPNVGKTSLFNALTGSRHSVGNYPGMTVERREGALASRWGSAELRFVDLPGTYSLSAVSEDEAVAFRCLRGIDAAPPEAVLLVLDGTNLARNLYFALQVLELELPTVIALNMVDAAREAGLAVDVSELEAALGVQVVETNGRTGDGVDALIRAFEDVRVAPAREYDEEDGPEVRVALAELEGAGTSRAQARWLLCCGAAGTVELTGATAKQRTALSAVGRDACWAAARRLVSARYRTVDSILVTLGVGDRIHDAPAMRMSERVDRVLTHPVLGLVGFVATMALVFVSIYWWADPLVGMIEDGFGALSEAVASALGPGLLTDLITEGLIAGVGNVLVFVPQIAMLFLFLGLLEDSGYLARAAFLLDKLMSKLGLHGRAFIPLLSGYACSIPAIMGTRTISSWKDRVVTILMIPYMSCSARLPIYALVIGALFVTTPEEAVISPSVDRGLLLLSMYLLSTVSALAIGYLYKRTILASPTPPLVLELPPYRLPRVANTLAVVWDKTLAFIKGAGTVILAFTIVLWAFLSFPREDTGAGGEGPTRIEASYGGRAAKTLEPLVEPIGQDWRVGIGILGSFAAREVLVSTLGLAYGMEADDDNPVRLREAMRSDVDEAGNPVHTKLSGLALMVFFVYACQCMSTVAVVKRETRGWKWPIFMVVSMTAIAYVAALVVFQGGRLLGFG